jgi:hypothetical protein
VRTQPHVSFSLSLSLSVVVDRNTGLDEFVEDGLVTMWCTAISGNPLAAARLLAAVAPTARQPAIPGPRV